MTYKQRLREIKIALKRPYHTFTLAPRARSVKDIILILYGNEYLLSGSIFTLLSFGFLFQSMAYINGKWILLKNIQMISLYRTLFGAIINIVLNYYLIPIYGVFGAVYATLLTLFLSIIMYYLVHRQTKDLFFIQIKALFTFFIIQRIGKNKL